MGSGSRVFVAAIVMLISSTAVAQVYRINFDDAHYQPVNGHYYGIGEVNAPWPATFTTFDIDAYLATLAPNGRVVHLATFNTYEEFAIPGYNSDRGYVGATGNNIWGTYTWSDGDAVQSYGLPFTPSTDPRCPPNNALGVSVNRWGGRPHRIACIYPNGGTSALRFSYEMEVPAIDDVSPAPPYAAGDTIVIMGSGFVEGSALYMSGVMAASLWHNTRFMEAVVPVLSSKDYLLEVRSPGGIVTEFTIISNPVPILALLSPPSMTAGGDSFLLAVSGSGFVAGSCIRWDGACKTTALVNGGQLTTTIAAADIANAGTANVTVYSPPPGGGESNQLPFAITAPATGVGGDSLSDRYTLHPNAPNPFNPMTTLRFDVPVGGRVQLAVYDVAGRLVRVLVEEELSAGSHRAVWDGGDSAGRAMPSGSYFARLEAGVKVETVRMSLVR